VRSKALWHTRHGLVRYFANTSLMCDNCRLYEQHHGNDTVRSEHSKRHPILPLHNLSTAPIACMQLPDSLTCDVHVRLHTKARPVTSAVTPQLMLPHVLQEIRAWADKMQSYVEQLLIEEHVKAEAQVRDALYSLASRR
jgi:hypothetical protein